MRRIAGLCALTAAGALLVVPAMAQSQNWNQSGVSSGWNGPAGGNGQYQSGYDQGGQWYGRTQGDQNTAGGYDQNFGGGRQGWGGNYGQNRYGENYDRSGQSGRYANQGWNDQNQGNRFGQDGRYANQGWSDQNQGNWQRQGNWQNQGNSQNRYGNSDQYRQGRGGQYGQGWNGQSGTGMNGQYGSSRFSGDQDRYRQQGPYPNRMGYRSDRNYSSGGQPFGGHPDRGD